jgi:DNA-binding transcriptional LysR family regulator
LGSIARAARAQNLTATAVGQRIAILEQHYEAELLDRSSWCAVPARACEELLPLAREIVTKFSEVESVLEPTRISGKLSLGAIRQLAKEASKLTLEIKPSRSEAIFSDLKDRRLGAAIIALPPFERSG